MLTRRERVPSVTLMIFWTFLKHVAATLTLAFLGVVLLNYMTGRCVEVIEGRLDAAVTLLEETHTLRQAVEELARGPVAWTQRAVSFLPFPLSLGVHALVPHSAACPLPDQFLCMSVPFLLRRLHILEEYNACLRRYVKDTAEGRKVLYFGFSFLKVLVLLATVAAVVVASWVFLEVLRVVSGFRVDALGSYAGHRDLLAALKQKLNPIPTSRTKKGLVMPPSSSSSSSVPTRWPSFSSKTFPNSSSSSSSSSYASTAPLSLLFASSRTPAAHTRKVSQQSLLSATALERARVKLFRALLILGWELLS